MSHHHHNDWMEGWRGVDGESRETRHSLIKRSISCLLHFSPHILFVDLSLITWEQDCSGYNCIDRRVCDWQRGNRISTQMMERERGHTQPAQLPPHFFLSFPVGSLFLVSSFRRDITASQEYKLYVKMNCIIKHLPPLPFYSGGSSFFLRYPHFSEFCLSSHFEHFQNPFIPLCIRLLLFSSLPIE